MKIREIREICVPSFAFQFGIEGLPCLILWYFRDDTHLERGSHELQATNQFFFHLLLVSLVGEINQHLLVCADAGALQVRELALDDALTLIQPDTHAEQLQETPHASHDIVAAVFVKIGKVACSYETVTLVALQRVALSVPRIFGGVLHALS